MPKNTYRGPSVSLYVERSTGVEFECRMNPSDDGGFPVLTLGANCQMYPSVEQLAELRDVIDRFLKAHPKSAALPDTSDPKGQES